MKNLLLIVLIFFFPNTLMLCQNNWYGSQSEGADYNSGASPQAPFKTVDYAIDFLSPGDTLFFMGKYVNESYNPDYAYTDDIYDPYIWHQENTIKIVGLNGTPGN